MVSSFHVGSVYNTKCQNFSIMTTFPWRGPYIPKPFWNSDYVLDFQSRCKSPNKQRKIGKITHTTIVTGGRTHGCS